MVACTHLGEINAGVKPNTPDGCEECLKEGTHWVQLRLCLKCGHVGCCDSSVGRHATKHFKATGHPIMTAYPNKEWKWCYVDKDYV